VDLEWDESKRQWTLANRDLDFADVGDFDFSTATTVADNRLDYGKSGSFRRASCMIASACCAGPGAAIGCG